MCCVLVKINTEKKWKTSKEISLDKEKRERKILLRFLSFVFFFLLELDISEDKCLQNIKYRPEKYVVKMPEYLPVAIKAYRTKSIHK